jgi:mannitol/fructose-specific phosphotransferase system IIA component (Ntr-type)
MATTISSLIDRNRVLLPLRSSAKEDVLDEMIDRWVRLSGREDLREKIRASVWEREREVSTGIGRGVAIPHAEIDAEFETSAVIGISPKGVDFDALDSSPVHIAFLLVCPALEEQTRLKILSGLSRLLGEASVRKALRMASSEEEVVGIIRDNERTE